MTRAQSILAPIVLGIFIGIELSLLFEFQDKNWLLSSKWPSVSNFFLRSGPSEANSTDTDDSQYQSLETSPVPVDADNQLEEKPKKMRILCWILTGPKNHEKKCKHVKWTWGRRCDKLIFMSTKEDPELGAVALPNTVEGRPGLWNKTKEALKYVWDNYKDDYDWFLKADDDTFVVMENLRSLLSDYAPDSPMFFGCLVDNKQNVKQGFMSGGAGYALSKEALRRFIEISLPNKTLCPVKFPWEDMALAKCLENVNVSAVDTRDSMGRHRFFPLSPDDILQPVEAGWWDQYQHYPMGKGQNCCSDTAISFHYINPREMHVLEYLIYRLKPVSMASK